jgi:hypothetical protein
MTSLALLSLAPAMTVQARPSSAQAGVPVHGGGFFFTPVSGMAPATAFPYVSELQWQSSRAWAQALGMPTSEAIGALDYAKLGEYGPPTTAGTPYPMAAPGQSALAYFQEYHPDWIIYQNDRKTVAYYGSAPDSYVDQSVVPLDLANPAVQAYVETTTVAHAVLYGYSGILFDHGTVLNKYGRAGHYNSLGVWVQEYSGAEVDPAYRDAIVAAFTAIAAGVRKDAAALGHPGFLIGINDPPDLKLEPSWWSALVAPADVLFDENGFMKNENTLEHVASSSAQNPSQDLATPDPWLSIVRDYQTLQAEGKAIVINSLVPYQLPSTGPTASDVEWVLANYMGVDEPATTMNFICSGVTTPGTPFLYPSTYEWISAYGANIGNKAGDLLDLGNGAYFRQFSHGAAFVNPSLQSVTVTVPAGYVDLSGQPVRAGPYLMPATSGLVLVTASSTGASVLNVSR